MVMVWWVVERERVRERETEILVILLDWCGFDFAGFLLVICGFCFGGGG